MPESYPKVKCRHCKRAFGTSNIKKHEKACNDWVMKKCPGCGDEFKARPHGKKVTCSYSCANKHFRSGEDNPNFQGKGYRKICFTFHKKRCVICSEKHILTVHHFDEDHTNNDPRNLIPLCPTHHQYVHSRYTKMVMPQIKAYRKEFVMRYKQEHGV